MITYILDHVLEYVNTVWTNSEKNIPLYVWWQNVSWCVLSKPIVPMSMIQAKKWSLELKILKFQGFFQKKCLKLQIFMLQEIVPTGNMSIERTFKSSIGPLLVFSRLFMKYISLFKVQNYCSDYPFSLRTHHFYTSNVASKTWISPWYFLVFRNYLNNL